MAHIYLQMPRKRGASAHHGDGIEEVDLADLGMAMPCHATKGLEDTNNLFQRASWYLGDESSYLDLNNVTNDSTLGNY